MLPGRPFQPGGQNLLALVVEGLMLLRQERRHLLALFITSANQQDRTQVADLAEQVQAAGAVWGSATTPVGGLPMHCVSNLVASYVTLVNEACVTVVSCNHQQYFLTRKADSMQAVLLTGHGGTEMLVYTEDVPVPPVAADDVLIKVGACGVNNTDIWTREGAYGSGADSTSTAGWKREPLQFPRIQGLDIAGKIVQVGSNVASKRVGERVIVNPTVYQGAGDGIAEADIIGSERDGGFAEYVAVPATNAYSITTTLTDVELATFPCSYLTAEHMLNQARVTADDLLLVTGASGGVGSALVQLAAHVRQARVVAVVGRGKEAAIQALGAAHVITRQTDDLYQAITAIAGERNVDVVADVVGGAQFGTLLRALRPNGRYVTAGAIAGPLVQLDLRTLYLPNLALIGSTLGTREEFAALVSHIEQGLLKPLVGQTYPLHAIRQAQADFVQKGFIGNLVLIPNAEATEQQP